MKALYLAASMLLCFIAQAQFEMRPMPFKQTDFKTIKAGGYTKCSVYELVGEDKTKVLVKEAEYGFAGMAATLSEKGTNDNGDSINTSVTYYKFDGKGNLILESLEVKNGDGDSYPTGYTYDGKNRLIEKTAAHIDPPTYKYKYDATGKLKEIKVTLKMPSMSDDPKEQGKAIDVPWSRYTVKCNAAGQVVEQTEYSLRGGEESKDPIGKYSWQYNADGTIAKYSYKNLGNNDLYTISYTYNKGLLIKSKETRTDEPEHEFVYEYCKGCKQSWMK